jgi:ABC-type polysaccharide transport system permease subunit
MFNIDPGLDTGSVKIGPGISKVAFTRFEGFHANTIQFKNQWKNPVFDIPSIIFEAAISVVKSVLE